MSKTTNFVKKSLSKESKTVFWMPPLFSGTSKSSLKEVTPEALREWLMSLPQASRNCVNLGALPVSEKVKKILKAGTSGRKQLSAFAWYDQVSSSWRTYQTSLFTDIPEEFSGTWPRQGIVVAGTAYRLQPQERLIQEIASGLLAYSGKLWPTPRASNPGSRIHSKGGKVLSQEVKMAEGVMEIPPVQRKPLAPNELLPTPCANPPGWKNIEVVDKHGNPPTHANQRFYDKNTGRLVQKGLEQVVRMYPSPVASDAGAGAVFGEDDEFYITKTGMPRKINRTGADGSIGLARLVQMMDADKKGELEKRFNWRTPNAHDAHRGPKSKKLLEECKTTGRSMVTLVDQVHHGEDKQYRTPSSRDWKGESAKSWQTREKGDNTPTLADQIAQDARATKGKSEGQLSSSWVCWLMQWPIFWTELEPLPEGVFDAWYFLSSNGIWWIKEPRIPRLTTKQKNRRQQIEAIGNGQVPLCVVLAWCVCLSRLLTWEFE